ncbi:MAG TPA: hypothetical protein VF799_01535 [Geobacteraceae bacterium]
MHYDSKFEEFLELYNVKRAPIYARANFKARREQGVVGFLIIFLIGVCFYTASLWVKNFLAIPLFLTGVTLIVTWGIFAARTPTGAGLTTAVTKKLSSFYEDGEVNCLMQYLSTQYTFEIFKPSWRNSIGIFLFSISFGDIIGSINLENKDAGFMISSILIQSVLTLIPFAYLVTALKLCRVDKIVMAMQDIKNFDFEEKRFK